MSQTPLPTFDINRMRLYTRTMGRYEHASIDLLDELVRKGQELADLYVRALDENPGARVEKPHDATQVDNLLQALARFSLAERLAIDAVVAYAAGMLEPSFGEGGDF